MNNNIPNNMNNNNNIKQSTVYNFNRNNINENVNVNNNPNNKINENLNINNIINANNNNIDKMNNMMNNKMNDEAPNNVNINKYNYNTHIISRNKAQNNNYFNCSNYKPQTQTQIKTNMNNIQQKSKIENLECIKHSPLDTPDNNNKGMGMRTASYSNLQTINTFTKINECNNNGTGKHRNTINTDVFKTYLSRNPNLSNKKECPLCRKPVNNNFYCEKCNLNHLIPFVQNSYILFIKNNIANIIKNRPKESLTQFLANLVIVYPNNEKKTFSESFYLLSDNDKNIFGDKLNNFKSSLCLGCFKFLNKENNFTNFNEKGINEKNTFLYRFPCGCIFCSADCLNRFINAVPLKQINTFTCGCGIEYNYIKLKFLLYFALSHNLIYFKNEVLRYMYEIIKDKCCKCHKVIILNQGKSNNINIMEVKDKEAEQIFGINKFNHLICDKCIQSREILSNRFCCSLCSSEHIILSKQNLKNCQIRNTCSIF
jgi:hypothetical protein